MPLETKYDLPGEHVFFWNRERHTMKQYDKDHRKEYHIGRSTRMVDRWSGFAVVVGLAYAGEAHRDYYWIMFGGSGVLFTGLHQHPA